jgi:16S rRNA (guanine966-N2)-methyltransferase
MPMPEGGRVIAGTAKGVRLAAPPSGTRPLTDRVKESLFSSLESDDALSGTFMDLFAGSGAAGIEALSRGSSGAVFVERDRRACDVIRANLIKAQVGGGQVVCRDVLSYLVGEREQGPFATVFVDPPYDSPVLDQVLDELAGDSALLEPRAIVVAKHFWRDEPPEIVGQLTRYRQKRFGETALSYYTRDQ